MSIIYLDSDDRINPSQPACQYTFYLKNPIEAGSTIVLESVRVPLTYYNVDMNASVVISATTYTVTVSGRFGSATELLTAFVSALNTATGKTFNYALNAYSGRVTITCNNSFSIDPTSDLWILLGATPDQTGSGTSLVLTNPHKFAKTFAPVLLKLGVGLALIGNVPQVGNTTFILQYPLGRNQTEDLVEFVDPASVYRYTVTERLTKLDVALTSLSGRPLDLREGSWSVTLFVIGS